MARALLKKWLPIFLTGLLITVIVFLPVVTNIAQITTSPNDGPLTAWIIENVALNLLSFSSVYELPFFYPYQNTLTYAEPFFSSAMIHLLIRPAHLNLITALNVQILASSALCFFAMYLLADKLFHDKLASLTTAFFFTFSYLHLEFAGHLHVFMIAAIPLGLYFLIRYLESGKYPHLLGFCVAYLFQALNDPMTGYFFITIMLIVLLVEGWWKTLFRDKTFCLHILALLLLSVSFYLPYFSTSAEFGLVRTIRDTAHFSYSLERFTKIDLIIIVGLVGSLFFVAKKRRLTKKSYLSMSTIILVGLVGAVFMLGPVLKISGQTWKPLGFAVPLPYAIAYYVVPGLKAFRAVTRWSVLLNFSISLLIGWLIVNLDYSQLRLKVVVGLFASLMLVYSSYQLQFFSVNSQTPAIYQTTAEVPGLVLAELPAYLWDMTPYDSVADERLLYQVNHQKKLFNGVSGLVPPQRIKEVQLLYTNFPDESSVEMLEKNDVALVLVHFAEYEKMFREDFEYLNQSPIDPEVLRVRIDSNPRLKLIKCEAEACLYSLQ